jgi:hypothetical protein
MTATAVASAMRIRIAPPFVRRSSRQALLGVARAPAIAFTPRTESEEGILRSGSLPQGVRPVRVQPSVWIWVVAVLDSLWWVSAYGSTRREKMNRCLEIGSERLPAPGFFWFAGGDSTAACNSKVQAGFVTDETLTEGFESGRAAIACLLTRYFSPPFRDKNHKVPA